MRGLIDRRGIGGRAAQIKTEVARTRAQFKQSVPYLWRSKISMASRLHTVQFPSEPRRQERTADAPAARTRLKQDTTYPP